MQRMEPPNAESNQLIGIDDFDIYLSQLTNDKSNSLQSANDEPDEADSDAGSV